MMNTDTPPPPDHAPQPPLAEGEREARAFYRDDDVQFGSRKVDDESLAHWEQLVASSIRYMMPGAINWPMIVRSLTAALAQMTRERDAAAARAQIPPGWKLVPLKPTWGLDAMSGAGAEALPAVRDICGIAGSLACAVYEAMLAAAPTPTPPDTVSTSELEGGA